MNKKRKFLISAGVLNIVFSAMAYIIAVACLLIGILFKGLTREEWIEAGFDATLLDEISYSTLSSAMLIAFCVIAILIMLLATMYLVFGILSLRATKENRFIESKRGMVKGFAITEIVFAAIITLCFINYLDFSTIIILTVLYLSIIFKFLAIKNEIVVNSNETLNNVSANQVIETNPYTNSTEEKVEEEQPNIIVPAEEETKEEPNSETEPTLVKKSTRKTTNKSTTNKTPKFKKSTKETAKTTTPKKSTSRKTISKSEK